MTLSINDTIISTANVVFSDTKDSIAIDFSPIFLRIALALEELANNSSNVVGVLSTVASATYLAANNTANLANVTYLVANNTTNLVTSFNNNSNSNFVQSNNLVASVYSVVNTANSNNIDLLSILDLLVSNTEILSNNSSEFVDLAAGRTNSGVKILSPWEWLSMSSIVKLYTEQGLDLTALKKSVDVLPKSE